MGKVDGEVDFILCEPQVSKSHKYRGVLPQVVWCILVFCPAVTKHLCNQRLLRKAYVQRIRLVCSNAVITSPSKMEERRKPLFGLTG